MRFRAQVVVTLKDKVLPPENQIALSLYLSAGFSRTGEYSGIEPELSLDLTDLERISPR